MGHWLVVKLQIAFVHQKMQFLNNISLIVMSPSSNQPPYDPHFGLVTNADKSVLFLYVQ